jgi:serine/threonine-protein kinase
MGEVYLADDLTLAQGVALKFLPESVERDPARLEQLQDEVRLARQISHPNICRVYDIAEADGVHFLTMEYVDGEDLASLIKRIGRLPEDRATELARQLAAGVAAAHARGVLHRDLKPANVMIDGDGRLRVTDFGLAIAGDSSRTSAAGTPAYMAPEQLAGGAASVGSDVFALGLVLYELFTGRRAFFGRTLDELREQHATRALTPPTEIVASLNPSIERLILQCLDPDPHHRPTSALAVAAALPGADPLAAALAAGETPSPEMVAASGGDRSTLTARAGAMWAVATLAMLGMTLVLADRLLLVARVPLPLSSEVLADRARTFESSAGFANVSAARATGWQLVPDAIAWIQNRPAGEHTAHYASARPPVLVFWSRTSPRHLVPRDNDTPRAGPNDPPFNDTGMTLVVMDTTGRLLEFASVPVQREDAATGSTAAVDWSAFFRAAGLEMTRFTPATPEWTPRVYADRREAWTGDTADLMDVTLRVEAASHRGVPVNFQVIGPWARPTRMTPPSVNRSTQLVTLIATGLILPTCLVGGLVMARRNLQRGRGDRRGALVIASLTLGLALLHWLVYATHYLDVVVEQSRLGAAVGRASVSAALLALLYLAVEPHIRRLRPEMLVTWSRLVAGRWRDSMLGRDLVMGTVCGLMLTLITFAHYFLPERLGWPMFAPPLSRLAALEGTAGSFASVLEMASASLQNAMLGGVGLMLAHLVVRRLSAAFALATVFFAFLASQGQIQTGALALDFAIGALLVITILYTLVRFGFVAGFFAFMVHFLTLDFPTTLDPAHRYFAVSSAVVALIVAGIVAGVVLATSPARAPHHAPYREPR